MAFTRVFYSGLVCLFVLAGCSSSDTSLERVSRTEAPLETIDLTVAPLDGDMFMDDMNAELDEVSSALTPMQTSARALVQNHVPQSYSQPAVAHSATISAPAFKSRRVNKNVVVYPFDDLGAQ